MGRAAGLESRPPMAIFTTTDDCRIYYKCHGPSASTKTVVLLNGTTQTTINWKPVVDCLADEYRVLTYDARGQGQSTLGRDELTLRRHVDDLVGLLDHLSLDGVSLVGISHGSGVAVQLAAIAGDRVRGMLLFGMGAALPPRVRTQLRRWLTIIEEKGLEAMIRAFIPVVFGRRFLETNAPLLEGMIQAAAKRNVGRYLQAHFTAMLAYQPLSEVARRAGVPVMVVSTDEDPLVDKGDAAALALLLGGKHRHLEGYGHALLAEDPSLFCQIMIDFLNGVPAPTGVEDSP